jgi:hypothetical protein
MIKEKSIDCYTFLKNITWEFVIKMEVKKEIDDSKEVENEHTNLEDDRERKLPAWMLTSDETPTQNEESAKSPPPNEDKEETTETAAATSVLITFFSYVLIK